MKTVMNKVITPNNKAFQRVAEAVNEIVVTEPGIRKDYEKGLEETEEEITEASAAKDTAETIEDFDLARDREERAKEKRSFYKRQIEKLDFSPRISEDTYDGYVKEISDEVCVAAEAFKKTASQAMTEIVKAWKSYVDITTEADRVLELLDEKARVLQVKYRYHEDLRTGEGGEGVVCVARHEDPGEWRQHALRYTYGYDPKGYKLAVVDGLTRMAWYAAQSVKED